MVCAFVPLFTMQGPEGQIFGPMADTYAFALCGAGSGAHAGRSCACSAFKNLRRCRDNWLVRDDEGELPPGIFASACDHPLRDASA